MNSDASSAPPFEETPMNKPHTQAAPHPAPAVAALGSLVAYAVGALAIAGAAAASAMMMM